MIKEKLVYFQNVSSEIQILGQKNIQVEKVKSSDVGVVPRLYSLPIVNRNKATLSQ